MFTLKWTLKDFKLCSRVFVPRLHFLPRFYVKGVGPRTTRTHVSWASPDTCIFFAKNKLKLLAVHKVNVTIASLNAICVIPRGGVKHYCLNFPGLLSMLRKGWRQPYASLRSLNTRLVQMLVLLVFTIPLKAAKYSLEKTLNKTRLILESKLKTFLPASLSI